MKYYKIIDCSSFIGVGTSSDMRRFQTKHKIILACNESRAQYIQVGDNFYHDMWMLPIGSTTVEYKNADIIQIEKNEYDILLESAETGEIILEEPIKEIESDQMMSVPTGSYKELTVSYVREKKIEKLSKDCSVEIMNGIDIELEDGKVRHFSLTIQDQLNLIAISSMISSGQTSIVYHADGEVCRYYSAGDMMKIIKKANEHKEFNIAYFNSLKSFVNSLTQLDEIIGIKYGDSIPLEYQSDVLKVIQSS